MRYWNMQRKLQSDENSELGINQVSAVEAKTGFDSFNQVLEVLTLECEQDPASMNLSVMVAYPIAESEWT